jgi:hypothetical protein
VTEFRTGQPIIHFVGSIPLPDAETVFRTLAESAGSNLRRLPDGETGIRKTWIRFPQQVLADNPAIEVATDVPPFKFTQWDGKLLREIPRLRVKPGATPDPDTFETGYADVAIASWKLFERLQKEGIIPATVKFQISLPTPIAPTYNNMVPSDRPRLLPALTRHLTGEVAKIAASIPNDRIAVQWMCARKCWPGKAITKRARRFPQRNHRCANPHRQRSAWSDRTRLSPLLRQPGRRALRPAQGHGDHGRNRECDQCWRRAPDPILSYAGPQGAHR